MEYGHCLYPGKAIVPSAGLRIVQGHRNILASLHMRKGGKRETTLVGLVRPRYVERAFTGDKMCYKNGD